MSRIQKEYIGKECYNVIKSQYNVILWLNILIESQNR